LIRHNSFKLKSYVTPPLSAQLRTAPVQRNFRQYCVAFRGNLILRGFPRQSTAAGRGNIARLSAAIYKTAAGRGNIALPSAAILRLYPRQFTAADRGNLTWLAAGKWRGCPPQFTAPSRGCPRQFIAVNRGHPRSLAADTRGQLPRIGAVNCRGHARSIGRGCSAIPPSVRGIYRGYLAAAVSLSAALSMCLTLKSKRKLFLNTPRPPVTSCLCN
jgi:hypothetical protein